MSSKSEELPLDASCLRVLRREATLHFDAGTGLPNWKAFEPSSEDKKKSPIRVSVFSEDRTTAEQAIAIRRVKAKKPSTYVVFAFLVGDAVAIGAESGVSVRVVRDLEGLDPMVATMPGADGHCGIEGLEDGAAPDPDTAKAVRDELALRCRERKREE